MNKHLHKSLGALLIAISLALCAAPPAEAGFRACENRVRFEYQDCDTGGLFGPAVWEAFPYSQIDGCRDSCDQCCDNIPTEDLYVVLDQVEDICTCLSSGVHLAVCLTTGNPDGFGELISTLVGTGVLGNIPADLPFDDPAAKIGTTGGDQGLWGKNLQLRLVTTMARICSEGIEWAIENTPTVCKNQCKAAFPRRTEHPQPPGGGGGGTNNDLPDDPLPPPGYVDDPNDPFGVPGLPCAHQEDQPCTDTGGYPGYLTPTCDCVSEHVDVTDGHQCWECNFDQDPPAWCDEVCWDNGIFGF